MPKSKDTEWLNGYRNKTHLQFFKESPHCKFYGTSILLYSVYKKKRVILSVHSYMHAQSCPTLCLPWSVVCQAPLAMGLIRQEYWNGLSFPCPRDLHNLGIKPGSPAFQVIFCIVGRFFTNWATKKAQVFTSASFSPFRFWLLYPLGDGGDMFWVEFFQWLLSILWQVLEGKLSQDPS